MVYTVHDDKKMKMIDNIAMEFKSVGFGDFEKNWNY